MDENELIGSELIPYEAEFKDIQVITENKEIYNYLRPHEAKMLIEATGTPRDHLLFNIFWQSGGRISEILSLRPMDITDAGIQMVTLKQRKNLKRRKPSGTWVDRPEPVVTKKTVRRNIPIKPELSTEVMTYAYKAPLQPGERFFPITPRRVQQILDGLGKKCNITYKKLHPHLFRHGFAVNFINHGGSLDRLKKILGHNHIQTTMMYLQLTDSDLKRDIDRMVF
ncbi:MAG: tyrosine-type recombinase/integrase [Candidatus Ratteibacteria bacterium]|nr:tyrosine-type recombinase/integrase [Candidatus Ratteibacteria bacterium]